MSTADDDPDVSVATMLANGLRSGTLHEWVQRAALVFDRGIDDEQAAQQAAIAFELRLLLEEVAMRTGAPALIDALALADESLQGCGAAVLLIDDARYASATRDAAVDEETWWGRRASMEAELPAATVEARLTAEHAEGSARVFAFPGVARPLDPGAGIFLAAAADADVVSRVRALATCAEEETREHFEQAMQALEELPCPWLRADLREAVVSLEARDARARLGWRVDALREATSPAPGRVPLLLYLPELHRGLVAELRLSRSTDGLWTHASTLLPLARDAIRTAHAAAASMAPSGQPRFALEQHTVRIVGPRRALEPMRAVDGTSLALPAAIAFLSLWLGIPPSRDIAATGGLETVGGRVGIRPVGPAGLRAKAEALAAWTSGATVRLLAQHEAPTDIGAKGVSLQSASDLHESVRQAGLPLDAAPGWSALGDEATRVAALERHIHELRTQQLEAHHIDGHSPWAVLGDRMQLLIGSLGASHGDLLHRARAYCALAYTHAGDTRAAQLLAGEAEIDEATPPPVRAMMLMSDVVRAIGQESFDECKELSGKLEEVLSTLRTNERHALLGVVRGTLGRAHLHDTRFSVAERIGRATALLQEAVEHHVRHQPVESARSRVYLAMALRMANRLDDARLELSAAEVELENHTKPWSGAYYAATRMYLDYERARCAVAAGEVETALRAGYRALEACDGRGFWPSIGILRTLAWAHRMGGDPTAARECVERMGQLAQRAPAGTAALVERIVREARGTPRTDGEVY